MFSANRKPIHLRLWHHRIGLTAAAFALLLSITGLLLNHTEDLNLDSSYIKSRLLLNWYGIKAPKSPLSYKAGGHWISQLGKRLYLDGRELATREIEENDSLVGAVKLGDSVAVGIAGHLILLDSSGEVIETLGAAEGVPAGMRAIGLSEGRLAVRASHGDYVTDEGLSRWEEDREGKPSAQVDWARPTALPENLYDRLADAYRGKGLTTERVVLDLHSGRIVGLPGVLVIDFMALAIGMLALSGLWMWIKHARRTKAN